MHLFSTFGAHSFGSGPEASSLAKGILYRKAVPTVSDRSKGGLVPIA
jgi:hypothetical protein